MEPDLARAERERAAQADGRRRRTRRWNLTAVAVCAVLVALMVVGGGTFGRWITGGGDKPNAAGQDAGSAEPGMVDVAALRDTARSMEAPSRRQPTPTGQTSRAPATQPETFRARCQVVSIRRGARPDGDRAVLRVVQSPSPALAVGDEFSVGLDRFGLRPVVSWTRTIEMAFVVGPDGPEPDAAAFRADSLRAVLPPQPH